MLKGIWLFKNNQMNYFSEMMRLYLWKNNRILWKACTLITNHSSFIFQRLSNNNDQIHMPYRSGDKENSVTIMTNKPQLEKKKVTLCHHSVLSLPVVWLKVRNKGDIPSLHMSRAITRIWKIWAVLFLIIANIRFILRCAKYCKGRPYFYTYSGSTWEFAVVFLSECYFSDAVLKYETYHFNNVLRVSA